jgi:NAD(P)-dependent dehydrogenase (short-subunit alcohol dehydrogenase family)
MRKSRRGIWASEPRRRQLPGPALVMHRHRVIMLETAVSNSRAPAEPVVIVTGGARGLGRAMTLALLRGGARVAVADLPESGAEIRQLEDLARREDLADRLACLECDITRSKDCERAVSAVLERFGALHGLVNNAGVGMQNIGHVLVGRRKRFFEVAPETWRRTIEANFNGAFLMARAVTPTLVQQGWGRIVNITTSFFTMMMEGFSPYGPSKAALEAATVIWARDLAGTGVTVNALLPGGPANTRMIPDAEVSDRATLIQPDVMMAPIVWLMSGRSDGVTGRRIIAKEWTAESLQQESTDRVGSPAGWNE